MLVEGLVGEAETFFLVVCEQRLHAQEVPSVVYSVFLAHCLVIGIIKVVEIMLIHVCRSTQRGVQQLFCPFGLSVVVLVFGFPLYPVQDNGVEDFSEGKRCLVVAIFL